MWQIQIATVCNIPLSCLTKGYEADKKSIRIEISSVFRGVTRLLHGVAAVYCCDCRSIERCQRFSNLAAATLAQSGNFSREAKEGNCVAQLEIAGDRRKNGRPEKEGGGGGGGRRVRED